MSRPKLLILDEPSAALAPKLVEEIYKIVSQIHADGMTILLVEQNVRMALTIADYAYIIRDGKIVFEGTSENLLKHEDVKSFYLGKM
jgi:branched-chain amino acid transport system ATP-binding protein